MPKVYRLLILLIILFASVGCDQATKSIARTYLSDEPAVLFLNGIIRLEYPENPGAFLSFGAGLTLLLIASFRTPISTE